MKIDQTITFTSDELTVLSDILRRQSPGGIFTGRPEFVTAIAKVESSKWPSYGGGGTYPYDEALTEFSEQFPLNREALDQEAAALVAWRESFPVAS